MAEESDESGESDGSEGSEEREAGAADAEERGQVGDGLRRWRRGLGGLATGRKSWEKSGDSVRSMTTGRELGLSDEQRGSGGGESTTVFTISGWDGKTGRAAPSVKGKTPRLRNDGLMGSKVAVPDSWILGRRTLERGFEPGVVRGAEICFLGLVGG